MVVVRCVPLRSVVMVTGVTRGGVWYVAGLREVSGFAGLWGSERISARRCRGRAGERWPSRPVMSSLAISVGGLYGGPDDGSVERVDGVPRDELEMAVGGAALVLLVLVVFWLLAGEGACGGGGDGEGDVAGEVAADRAGAGQAEGDSPGVTCTGWRRTGRRWRRWRSPTRRPAGRCRSLASGCRRRAPPPGRRH